MSPRLSVPDCTSTVATGPRPLSRRDSMTMPLAGASLGAFSSSTSACSRDRLEQRCRCPARSSPTPGRTACRRRTPRARRSRATQLLLDALGIRLGLVDLVDRDDDRHLAGLGVRDRFLRLRHHAVVGGDDQNHDVGDLGAARAHRRERLVARRVEERDHAARRLDVVRADVLRDAARLAARHARAADRSRAATSCRGRRGPSP